MYIRTAEVGVEKSAVVLLLGRTAACQLRCSRVHHLLENIIILLKRRYVATVAVGERRSCGVYTLSYCLTVALKTPVFQVYVHRSEVAAAKCS